MIVGLANHTILIAKDGIERPIDDSAAPIRNAAGDIAGSVLVFRDISDRRRQEEELQRKHDVLTMAENAARSGHFEWIIPDDDSRWSREIRVTGRAYPIKEAEGGHGLDIGRP